MKKKSLGILVCMLFVISAFTVVAGTNSEETELTTEKNSSQPEGVTTLIAEEDNNRVIEVDSDGDIVWEKTGLYFPTDAERLENGNTLIVDTKFNEHRVIEVDSNGDIVWEKTGLHYPWDAERLGINQPPNKPTITGEISGTAGIEYEYTFNAVDPDGDDVRYIVDWDDGNSDTTDFSPSGTDVIVSHTWTEQGTYTIKAKAEDTNGLIGPEATKTVTMPRNKATYDSLFLQFLERFPLLEVFLSRIINL